jgi:hypothetical protein
MANKHTYQSCCWVKRCCRSGWYASVVGSLMIPAIAIAATPSTNQAVVKQLALNAYCSEAQSKSTSMANGSTSYKRIAELASNRALADHPGIYSDSSRWEYIINGILDQYGDEPTSQLCTEKLAPES